MSALELTKIGLKEGIWRGVLTGTTAADPQIEVTHENSGVPDVELTKAADGKSWTLNVPIPMQAIADGLQTLIIRDVIADAKIGHITLIAGEELDDDIRAELSLLRAELDMLKRAFRRHCVETA